MAKSWLKGLWIVTLSGIIAFATVKATDDNPPNGLQGLFPASAQSLGSLRLKSHQATIGSSFAKLGFLLELRRITPASSPDEALAIIRRYEHNLAHSEAFYLESCLATIPLDSSLSECERLLYQGLNQLTDNWRIPIVMGMISAITYQELDKAAAFFNLALGKAHLPESLAGFPRVESDEAERLAVRISSLVRVAARDPIIENYRRSLKHAIANRESSSNAAADPGSQEPREAF